MHKPSAIELLANTPALDVDNLEKNIIENRDDYEKQLKQTQKTLLQVQQAYYRQKKRAIIVFEGWDAAGKGGCIRRLTEKLDPRGFRVHPIAAPREDEQGRHYLYRFQKRLPKPGMFAIFDRSYYGRVLVERVEQLASKREWQRAYQEINEFERLLIDDDVRIIKFFLHISPEEQLKRFDLRLNDPIKQWKLTEEDIRNRQKRQNYEIALNDMFEHTHTAGAPWQLISSNHKWYTRVAVLTHLAEKLSEGMDISPPPLDPKVVKAAKAHLGLQVK